MNTLHDLVAEKLEHDPSLLRVPLENIDRWLANGHTAPRRLEQWRQIIQRAQQSPEGFAALLVLLRDRDEATERLREFAPFAGVLTAAERLTVIRQCAYSHSRTLSKSSACGRFTPSSVSSTVSPGKAATTTARTGTWPTTSTAPFPPPMPSPALLTLVLPTGVGTAPRWPARSAGAAGRGGTNAKSH